MKRFRILLMTALCMTATAGMAQNYSNNFENRRLDETHFHLMDKDESIVNMGTRGMTIMAKGDNVQNSNVVYFDATDKKWEAEAHMILYPKSEAGLFLMKDRTNFWGVTATYDNIYVRTAEKTIQEIKNPYGRYLHMRLQYANGKLTISVAPQKTAWKITENANPTKQCKPATKWKVLSTLNVDPTATHIAFTADQNDVISVRNFWYRAKK